MGFLASVVREREQRWLFVQFPSAASGAEFDREALVPDETYVEIWLESMQIINARKLFTKFFPALTSEVAVTHAGKPRAITLSSQARRVSEAFSVPMQAAF